MIHTMYLGVVIDYDMYPEVSEWELDQTRKEDNIVDFWKFRDLLSNKMIRYNPTHRKYAGDANIIPATHHNQASKYKSKDGAREKLGRPLEEEVQFSNWTKKPK